MGDELVPRHPSRFRADRVPHHVHLTSLVEGMLTALASLRAQGLDVILN